MRYPAPGPNFNYAAVGVPADWHHNFGGFASHWNKTATLAGAVDLWNLNLFPRASRFLYNDGGYLTLSFIPTLGTMLLGLQAGEWFRSAAPRIPVKRLLVAGLLLIAAGVLLHVTGICPIVKRVWTPSWTLFSGGICFVVVSVFSWVIDVKSHRRWAFPLVVVGMNSIAAYLIAEMWRNFITSSLHIHSDYRSLSIVRNGPGAAHAWYVMLIYWFILFWMYRRSLFLRI